MGLHYFSEWVSRASVDKFCCYKGLDAKKTVFIFPGNGGHHSSSHNLYSFKSGGGLAIPAGQLGRLGRPVLSLPTTGMGNYGQSASTRSIVHCAIADLWRAMGAGYDLLIPVRTHNNSTYFDNSLNTDDNVEPNFWGQNLKTPNKALATFYITELDRIHDFNAVINSITEGQYLSKLQKTRPELFKAYMDGKKMQVDDPWLARGLSSTHHRSRGQIKFGISRPSDDNTPADISANMTARDVNSGFDTQIFLSFGSAILTTGGLASSIVGFLAVVNLISLSFPPAALIVAGTTSAIIGGVGLFQTCNINNQDEQENQPRGAFSP